MSQIFRKFPQMNSKNAIIKEIEDAMSKVPENFSEEQFKQNKNIPTIIMAQAISEQISSFNVQLIQFHLNSFKFNDGSVEQRYIDYVKTERMAATTSFRNLQQDVTGFNAFLEERQNVQIKKDQDTSAN